jgi:hypothetical protein
VDCEYQRGMALSPTYALAHVFLPNLTKLQGPHTFVAAVERGKKEFFAPVWAQAQIEHDPVFFFLQRDPYRVAVLELPPSKDTGEAHMIAVVTRSTDQWFWKYFTLERDYVLATQSFRTLICERDGAKHRKIGPGPVLTGVFKADATAFADLALLPVISAQSLVG